MHPRAAARVAPPARAAQAARAGRSQASARRTRRAAARALFGGGKEKELALRIEVLEAEATTREERNAALLKEVR